MPPRVTILALALMGAAVAACAGDEHQKWDCVFLHGAGELLVRARIFFFSTTSTGSRLACACVRVLAGECAAGEVGRAHPDRSRPSLRRPHPLCALLDLARSPSLPCRGGH